jgi:hypothetical protein
VFAIGSYYSFDIQTTRSTGSRNIPKKVACLGASRRTSEKNWSAIDGFGCFFSVRLGVRRVEMILLLFILFFIPGVGKCRQGERGGTIVSQEMVVSNQVVTALVFNFIKYSR